MDSWHPLVVHFPIVLSIVWPIVDAVGLWRNNRDISRVGVALLIGAAATSFAATVTGQSAFDTAVAAQVSPELLNTHADNANLVPWAMMLLATARIVGELKLGKRGQMIAIGLGLSSWFLLYDVGQSGGALVFEQGIGVERSPTPR